MKHGSPVKQHLMTTRSRQHARPAELKPDSTIRTQSVMQHLSQISAFKKLHRQKNETTCFPYSNENNMHF